MRVSWIWILIISSSTIGFKTSIHIPDPYNQNPLLDHVILWFGHQKTNIKFINFEKGKQCKIRKNTHKKSVVCSHWQNGPWLELVRNKQNYALEWSPHKIALWYLSLICIYINIMAWICVSLKETVCFTMNKILPRTALLKANYTCLYPN